ncbi:MAG: Unknown protein [uncultured Sulfurovum sp.]|uniref:Cytochrome c domain-containing protein n=1 Tax=uncultured Sulfurovum sp. TaxID=269237 RepID=A0A6S6U5J7_9BACT|nr:MAG: Unknown protein [uncultured Sulfurovum sp.]
MENSMLMHKIVFVKIYLLVLLTLGVEAKANVYKDVCIECHQYQPATLEKMFMLYLKTHSVKLSFKVSLKEFLKNPTEEKSLIGNTFIKNFSVKNPTKLSDSQLDEAIDTYWDLYNPKDNLK